MKKKTILICGAGGFIGGHLTADFLKEGKYNLVCVDIKPKEYWFQYFDDAKNFSLDLKEYENCLLQPRMLIIFIIFHAIWVVWVI